MKASPNVAPGSLRPRSRRRRRRPRGRSSDWIILALLLPASLLGLVFMGGVRIYVAGPLTVVTYLAALVLVVRSLLDRDDPRWRIAPGLAGLALFGVYLFASIPRAAVPHETLVEGLKFASYVVAYWVFTELSSARSRWRLLLALPLFVGMCLCWYALYQHAHDARMVLWLERPEQYEMRASGTYICPNHFAQVLVVLMVLGTVIAGIPSAGWPLRIFAAYVAILALPVLVLSGSRSGWLGAVAGLGTVAVLTTAKKGWRRLAVVLPAFALAVVVVFAALWYAAPVFKHRVELALKGDIRIPIWTDTLDMIAAAPALGHGGGSYRWVFQSFQDTFMPRETYVRYAHNEYLHVAAEYGVVGAVLLLAAWLGFVVRLLRVLAQARERKSIFLAAGLLGCMAAVTVHSFFDFNLHIFANVHLLALVAGVGCGALYASGDLTPMSVSKRVVWVAAPAATILLVLLSVLTLRATVAYTYAGRAEEARGALDFDAALRQARTAERFDPLDWRGFVEEGHVLKTRAFWDRDPDISRELGQEALVAYERALERNPYDLFTKLELSRTHGDVLGEEEQAEALLREIVQAAPGSCEFYAELGLRLRRMGKLEEALEAFQSAHKINSENEMVNLNLRSLTKILKE